MSWKVAIGLMYGLGGGSTSPGIDLLASEIKKLGPDVVVLGPYDQANWQQCAHDLSRYTVEKLVCIGYSMGANNTTFVANSLSHLDLLIAIQPTMWEQAETIPSKVKKAIEIYNPNVVETAGLGARKLTGFHTSYVTNSDLHPYADNDPAVHKYIVEEVRKLL